MTTFIPTAIMAKASKAGKTFWEIEIQDGRTATCFDYPIVQELEKSLNRPISFYDLEENDRGFLNIRKARQQSQTQTPIPVIAQVHETQAKAKSYDTTSMYVSYAKDLFICLREKEQNMQNHAILDMAIELVKKAKQAFS